VDVEYSAQYLQLQHGHDRPELRTPSTLEALERLRALRLLGEDDHRGLHDGYVFWRCMADGLRMVRGNARDLLLPEDGSQEMGSLARRLEYPGAGGREAGKALAADVARHRERVNRIFTARFRSRE
jgi:glutamate-ammonia-ligase adenylyltransferase